MPKMMPLVTVAPDKLARVAGLPRAQQIKTQFPKRSVGTAAQARAAVKAWQVAQPMPAAPRNPEFSVAAVSPTTSELSRLRVVLESDIGPSEALQNKYTAETLGGSLYSALATYDFLRMEGEYRRRLRAARNPAAIERQWSAVVDAAQSAFAAGGHRRPTPAQLSAYAKDLARNTRNLSAVAKIADSAAVERGAMALDARTVIRGSFVPILEKFVDPGSVIINVPDLCDDPIAQGTFTKHFSRSFALQVRLKVWCPTWSNPFRTCWKTFTIAGASFSIGLNVGYRVNCCGAIAWGQAYAEACVTVVGIKVCAGCSATVTGVAGIARTPVGSGCQYGIGVNAVLQCKLFGATVFYASVPFGWTVTGPCPPAGLCG